MSQPSQPVDHPVVTLENDYWQLGILPDTGASVAYLRTRHNSSWFNVLRPTNPADYGSSGKTSSFIMAPWCNRIRDGKLVFEGREYPLKISPDDGTARHGDVRQRAWQVTHHDANTLELSFTSTDYENVNFPFKFSVQTRFNFAADARLIEWHLTLANDDDQAFPCGFGFHPYFNRPQGDNAPLLKVSCDQQFNLVDNLAVAAPVPVEPRLDYRAMRLVEDGLNDVLTGCNVERQPIRLHYPVSNLTINMSGTALFRHWLLYTPPDGGSIAVEPMTNVNDAFNLYAQGIEGSGVIVLKPGESATAVFRITSEE